MIRLFRGNSALSVWDDPSGCDSDVMKAAAIYRDNVGHPCGFLFETVLDNRMRIHPAMACRPERESVRDLRRRVSGLRQLAAPAALFFSPEVCLERRSYP